MIVVDVAPWRMTYRGGRLADVHHVEFSTPVATVEVGDFDWSASAQRRELTRDDVERELVEWIATDSADVLRELPYMR